MSRTRTRPSPPLWFAPLLLALMAGCGGGSGASDRVVSASPRPPSSDANGSASGTGGPSASIEHPPSTMPRPIDIPPPDDRPTPLPPGRVTDERPPVISPPPSVQPPAPPTVAPPVVAPPAVTPPVTPPETRPPLIAPPTDDPDTTIPAPPAADPVPPVTTPPLDTPPPAGSLPDSAANPSDTITPPTAPIDISLQPYYLQDAASIRPAGTVLSSPDCSLRFEARPPTSIVYGPDPWRPAQWFLSNIGRVDWGDLSLPLLSGTDLNLAPLGGAYKGTGIRIAVVDDGIDFTHDDLRFSVLPNSGYDFRSLGRYAPLPCLASETHGTAVAGLIAAQENNSLGLAGVAPQAKLVSLNSLSTGNSFSMLSALSHRDTAIDIFNNSWGAHESGHFETPANPVAYRATIDEGLRNGRHGLGSIYVFSAGNGGCDSVNAPHCQGQLSVYDGYVNRYGTLAICAVNAQGKKTTYSEAGPNLLVCAPTSENDGTPPGTISTGLKSEYVSFSGTSSAAPMVSGVIAMMLQANPALSWRDVRLILARTARRVDPQHPGWRQSGGLPFNHLYGFGLVDAHAAVMAARSWQSVGGSEQVKQCGPFTATAPLVSRVPPVADEDNPLDADRPAAGYLLDTIEIPADCNIAQVEHVEVKLDIETESVGGGDLHARLISPSGQTSIISTPHRCGTEEQPIPCRGLERFPFGLARHLDEPAFLPGNRGWTLAVGDGHRGARAPLPSGDIPGLMFRGWELTLYGR
ncbi:MAG: S8 family serine peptidase [Lautropia sp.]|nr:S8 family serine peptidase [Lautropia sp.]